MSRRLRLKGMREVRDFFALSVKERSFAFLEGFEGELGGTTGRTSLSSSPYSAMFETGSSVSEEMFCVCPGVSSSWLSPGYCCSSASACSALASASSWTQGGRGSLHDGAAPEYGGGSVLDELCSPAIWSMAGTLGVPAGEGLGTRTWPVRSAVIGSEWPSGPVRSEDEVWDSIFIL